MSDKRGKSIEKLTAERDSLAAQLTAARELLREMWEYAGGPHYVRPDGVTLVPGADSTLAAVWAYLNGKEHGE